MEFLELPFKIGTKTLQAIFRHRSETLDNSNLAPPLKQFVDEVMSLLGNGAEEKVFLPKIGKAMQTLVGEDDWLDAAYAQEHPEHYTQYLLYADPEDRFSVVSFVWGPGQSTPIHDHTVWGAIGILRGAECERRFEIAGGGKPVPDEEDVKLLPGDVGFVSPTIGDVHQVRNALDDQVSISIHAYGGNIGKINRHVFPPEGGPKKSFVSGYSDPR